MGAAIFSTAHGVCARPLPADAGVPVYDEFALLKHKPLLFISEGPALAAGEMPRRALLRHRGGGTGANAPVACPALADRLVNFWDSFGENLYS